MKQVIICCHVLNVIVAYIIIIPTRKPTLYLNTSFSETRANTRTKIKLYLYNGRDIRTT